MGRKMKKNVDLISKKHVLLIAMADSVHVARWISNFDNSDTRFQIISTSPHRRIHPEIKSRLSRNVSMTRLSRYMSIPLWILNSLPFIEGLTIGLQISRAAKRQKFTHIHAMETQHGGYALSKAHRLNTALQEVPNILSLFGSDIFWFARFTRHRTKLRELLQKIDRLAVECYRDIGLSKDLGYTGAFFQPMPVSGGLEPDSFMTTEADVYLKKGILVKGYKDKWGQGDLALKAISMLEKDIEGIPVTFYSTPRLLALRIWWLNQTRGFDIRYHLKHSLTHKALLTLLKQSDIHIGLSRSDGLPSVFLETLAQGTFPIQTNSSCGSEWIGSTAEAEFVTGTSLDEIVLAIRRSIERIKRTRTAQFSNLHFSRRSFGKENFLKYVTDFYF